MKSEDYKNFQYSKIIIVDDNNNVVNIDANISKDDKNMIKINQKILLEKFKSLNISFDELNEFYSRLITKTTFYHNNMTFFNLKVINLEGKKENYTKSVKQILARNYQNFEDLVKSNSKFANFITKYGREKNVDYWKTIEISPNYPMFFSDFYGKCDNVLVTIKVFIESIITW